MPSMRRLAALTVVALVPTMVSLALPFSGAQAKPRPVPPHVTRAAMGAPDAQSSSMSRTDRTQASANEGGAGPASGSPAVLTSSQPTAVPPGLGVVGVTWDRGTARGASVQYRTRSQGRWGPWTFLAADEDHGPDPAEAKRASERGGSDPLVVTGADQIQMRVVGPRTERVGSPQVVVVDPGTSVADSQVGTATPGAAAAVATRPVIYTRAQWGADESLRDPSTLSYGAVKAAVVHHTVDSNSYTSSQVPALIRGIYAFHVKGRGWGDIGYNFLVDRFGRMWEGRYGGMTLPVVGAHTLNHNSWTTGISVIGNFDISTVPLAVTRSLTALIAWKAQIHQFNPLGRANIGDLSTNAVLGHRDAYQTACPGRYLYAKLPGIRANAGAIVAGLPSLSLDRDLDNRGNNDIVATNAAHDLLLYPTTNQRTLLAPKTLGSGSWQGVDLVTIAGDFNGDGPVDLIARQTATGQLLLYAGSGATVLRAARVIGAGWGGVDTIVGVSDWNGDGHPDLLARMHSDGSLRLYPGNGTGGFLAPRTVGVGWGGMRLISGIGDWSGDGARDLLAVGQDGTARIYLGNGQGGFKASQVLAGDWSGYASVNGVGDVSGDTRTDLFAVDGTGAGFVGVAGSTPGTIAWTRQSQSWSGVTVYSG
jgi:N-acetylmuramoyl-L-alanine amidase/FG-GAP-like repeat